MFSLDQKLSCCITWGTWGRYTHSMQFNRIFTPNISPWNLTYIYANVLYLEHPPKHLSELQNGIWNADAAHIQTLTFTQHMLAWRACHMYVDTPEYILTVFSGSTCVCVYVSPSVIMPYKWRDCAYRTCIDTHRLHFIPVAQKGGVGVQDSAGCLAKGFARLSVGASVSPTADAAEFAIYCHL